MHFERERKCGSGTGYLLLPFSGWACLFFNGCSFHFCSSALLEAQAKYPLEIGFHAEGVVLNSLFKKKFPWNSFQSVILKDGLLTLDFRNNKIFQKEVLDDDEPDAEEDEFNDYCRSKLVNL